VIDIVASRAVDDQQRRRPSCEGNEDHPSARWTFVELSLSASLLSFSTPLRIGCQKYWFPYSSTPIVLRGGKDTDLNRGTDLQSNDHNTPSSYIHGGQITDGMVHYCSR
jgi:hypothetical protein